MTEHSMSAGHEVTAQCSQLWDPTKHTPGVPFVFGASCSQASPLQALPTVWFCLSSELAGDTGCAWSMQVSHLLFPFLSLQGSSLTIG